MSDRTTDNLALSASEPAEPSMEDILASIRRIIADDGDNDANVATAPEVVEHETHTDIRDLAAIHPTEADQNTVLVEADTEIDDLLDLEDILVLSDDDFSADELEIPEIAIPIDDFDDDILIGDDDSLKAEIANMFDEGADLALTEPAFSPVQSSVMPSPAIAAETAEASTNDLMFDTDILSELADDIDLILDDGGDEMLSLEPSTADGSQILGIVEAGIADIESRDLGKSIEAVEMSSAEFSEVVVDAPSASPDAFSSIFADSAEADIQDSLDDIDLVSDLLSHTDEAPNFEMPDTPQTDHSKPVEVDFPKIDSETITGDEDIDLVKSLMAELTDETFLDTPIVAATEPEAAAEEIEITTSDPESEFLDDILDLAMADEIALSSFDKAEAAEPTVDLVKAEPVTQSEDFSGGDEVAADSVDASINALLEIAALAERDAETAAEEFSVPTEPVAAISTIEIPAPVSAVEILAPVEDVDMPLTPELKAEFDEIDAIFASDMDFDIEASFSAVDFEATTIDTILPEATDTTDLMDDYSEEISIPKYVAADDVLDEIFAEESKPVAQELPEPKPENTKSEDKHFENIKSEVQTSATQALAAQPIPPIPTPKQEPSKMPKLVAKDGIIDDLTERAASDAFASLNQVVEENTEYQESGPRIGDLVQEALRPMLKEWLDANLKGIVERAVSKEVKRISSGK